MDIEDLVRAHGEQYRQLIVDGVQAILYRAKVDPRINLATFNFARYIAELVFHRSIGF